MSAMESVGNLSRSGVRPLRNTARAQDGPAEPARRFSVDDLKSGGSMGMGAMLEGGEGRAAQSIREQYRGNGPAPSARRTQNSQLSTAEQVEKLGKIRKSAVEYEAVFVDQLVKQMRQSPMAKTPGGDTFSDIAEQPFRDFLSQNGGLGLADVIVGQVARQEGLEQTLQQYPGIMGPNWSPAIPPNLMQKHAGNLKMTAPAAEEAAKAPETGGGRERLLESILAGASKVAEEKAAGRPPETRAVGMMDSEEIAYLYNEAKDGQA